MKQEIMAEYFPEQDFVVTTHTNSKVPKWKPEVHVDTGSDNGYVGIFFNIIGMIMAVITLPLGLLQEFTIYHKRQAARDHCKEAHGTNCGLNTIQLEQRNISDPVHTYNFGFQTDFYKWCLVTQLICLLVIGFLVIIQKITNKAI